MRVCPKNVARGLATFLQICWGIGQFSLGVCGFLQFARPPSIQPDPSSFPAEHTEC